MIIGEIRISQGQGGVKNKKSGQSEHIEILKIKFNPSPIPVKIKWLLPNIQELLHLPYWYWFIYGIKLTSLVLL